MGQKVHPIGIRLGVIRKSNANWYADPKKYSEYLINDLQVRKYLEKKLKAAMISGISIERPTGAAKITIATARPGIIIGKKGEDIESLQKELTKLMGVPAQVSIEEITQPDLDARLVADGIASQLERRVMFRRAMKRAVQNSMKAGAQGIKVELSGRLGGAEIARSEWYREGRVPLHTLRADIDYSNVRAETTYGTIGVKVWIFRGEVLDGMNRVYNPVKEEKQARAPQKRRARNDRSDRPRSERPAKDRG
ncbi:MAG: 30S ribosomal protein S3 [Moraxella sp.]|jgi:small subunit ribosomal protein S3|uniref:Small ribosomal subunit protein uS3 n=3 Tax=Pseudomonadota TaxID=1224 RepID=A0A0X8K602_FAUOS|nr:MULTISPECIES: 30S ribosomal protein S3 [Pseudomonadota]EEV23500.1 ribosomal protein S3 [Enhydrobacter aerosaccus SK60]NOX78860.1 30S ribosomal protein S3 [Gammaproteobacteria bacterium]ONG37431.1 30S ribosomal protein S3 [Enhydrobacter sp. H5]RVU82992.1 30S ribosomal protein S3 [Leucothrix sargassi]TGP45735.1 30S ribosomal protein S3 [bacterium M00.F.Ca.ET.230.01.1.1]VWX30898.1 30S ribosomal protein S3 [Moraxellaceae bacterium 17A]GGL95454.1 30S ribosomal protein S3 [Streptomyces cinereus